MKLLRIVSGALFCFLLLGFAHLQAAPIVKLIDIQPALVEAGKDRILLDYGKIWFANVQIVPNSANQGNTIVLRLRESSHPEPLPSTGPEPIGVRFFETKMKLGSTAQAPSLRAADSRLMPADIGPVMPFRFVEIIGWKGPFPQGAVRAKAALAAAYSNNGQVRFSGGAHAEALNNIWQLSAHTMAATSFAGIFVDGDRERLPYEADAYINQLGWLATVGETSVARRTFEYLIDHPSWPTEWQAHMIFMAWADYMHTGDWRFLSKHYARLKFLTLRDLTAKNGLISTKNISPKFSKKSRLSDPLADIVDWPPNQRDGHEMVAENTVTNAFAYAGFMRMADIAQALHSDTDKKYFKRKASEIRRALASLAVLPNGLFSDGVGSAHTSAHSLFIPLAFGLVEQRRVALFHAAIKEKIKLYDGGLPASVFAAQYLLEALFQTGSDEAALALITNSSERGWLHMIKKYGASVTHEAWDIKFKDNEDWTHAWGAAPANIIPTYLLGLRPLSPGWSRWQLSPSSALTFSADASIPTPHGPIALKYDHLQKTIRVQVPRGTVCNYRSKLHSARLGSGNHVLKWD